MTPLASDTFNALVMFWLKKRLSIASAAGFHFFIIFLIAIPISNRRSACKSPRSVSMQQEYRTLFSSRIAAPIKSRVDSQYSLTPRWYRHFGSRHYLQVLLSTPLIFSPHLLIFEQ